jgi:hypothetical protein
MNFFIFARISGMTVSISSVRGICCFFNIIKSMKLWQKVCFLLGLFLLLLGIFLFIKPLLCDKESFYCLHTKQRYLKGIPPLTPNKQLEKAAKLRAYDIAIHNQFSHESISGQTMQAVATQSGYNYKMIGENLAIGDKSNAEYFDLWMKSASHSANILNPKYEDVGIYMLKAGSMNDRIIVSIFGTER